MPSRKIQKDLVLDIDVQGTRQLKAKMLSPYLPWLVRAWFWSKGSARGAKIAKRLRGGSGKRLKRSAGTKITTMF